MARDYFTDMGAALAEALGTGDVIAPVAARWERQ